MFKKTCFVKCFLAGIFGLLLVPAFAPFNYWYLSYPSLIGLLWVWRHASPRQAALLGLCYGLGLFGGGVSWVYVSIHEYGHASPLLAGFLTGGFVCLLSLFPALVGFVLQTWRFPSILAFPSLWLGQEWLRSWVLTGFPWLYLGYTHLDTPLKHLAPLTGVWGLSFMIALLSNGLFQRTWRGLFLMLLGIAGLAYWLPCDRWTQATGPTQTVSLIQGNIDPGDKFLHIDPLHIVENVYLPLTKSEWGRQLIVWPENAVAIPRPQIDPVLQQLNTLARQHHSTLILGVPQEAYADNYYNSMLALGMGQGEYLKRHLVIFGEYVPLARLLRGIIYFFDLPMSTFIPGPLGNQNLQTPNLNLAPYICYEIAYPNQVRSQLYDGQLIINLSEDGWFGHSIGPHQHLQIARMRALETGRMLLRATTSGISAIIDQRGDILVQSPQFQTYVLRGTVQARHGTTPWVRYGMLPWLGLGVVLWFRRTRHAQR